MMKRNENINGKEFYTFRAVLYGSLRPWLPENQDKVKFSQLMRRLKDVNGQTGPLFFRELMKACQNMGLCIHKNMACEWSAFSEQNPSSMLPSVTGIFQGISVQDSRLMFYHLLITSSWTCYLRRLIESLAPESTGTLRKHLVMNAMKSVSDLIIECLQVGEQFPAERLVLHDLLASLSVLYLEISTKYRDVAETDLLRITPGSVEILLSSYKEMDGTLQKMVEALYDHYFPQSMATPEVHSPAGRTGPENDTNRATGTVMEPAGIHSYGELRHMAMGMHQDVIDLSGMFKKFQSWNVTAVSEELPQVGSYEACQMLNISKSTLTAYRQRGLLRANHRGGRYYYSQKEILAFLSAGKGYGKENGKVPAKARL